VVMAKGSLGVARVVVAVAVPLSSFFSTPPVGALSRATRPRRRRPA